jgi:hypothetical protein
MGRAVRDRVRNNNYQDELTNPAWNYQAWSVSRVELETPRVPSAPGYVLLGAPAYGRLYWAWVPIGVADEMERCFLNYITGMSSIGRPRPIIESSRFYNRLDLMITFHGSGPMYQVSFRRGER